MAGEALGFRLLVPHSHRHLGGVPNGALVQISRVRQTLRSYVRISLNKDASTQSIKLPWRARRMEQVYV